MGSSSSKTCTTDENALLVFEKLLLYGFSNEQLAWTASKKYSNLNDINQAIDYIEKYSNNTSESYTSRMDNLHFDYCRLLLKTRITVLEEDSKCILVDDKKLEYKDCFSCYRQWIKTDIITSIISEWDSIFSRLLKEKEYWKGFGKGEIKIKNMIQMCKNMQNKLNAFQDAQNEIITNLDSVHEINSVRMLKTYLSEINEELDSYVDKRQLLVNITSNDAKIDNIPKKNSYYWTFMILSRKIAKDDITKIFADTIKENKIQIEVGTDYWLLLLTTRSKMKILLTKCVIRKRNISNLLRNNSLLAQNKQKCIDTLFTFDSTISTYTGLAEWISMNKIAQQVKSTAEVSVIAETSKIIWACQIELKNIQNVITENINRIEQTYKNDEKLKIILINIAQKLEKYDEIGKNILDVIEEASKQYFQNLYVN